jgi:hypothetical protein
VGGWEEIAILKVAQHNTTQLPYSNGMVKLHNDSQYPVQSRRFNDDENRLMSPGPTVCCLFSTPRPRCVDQLLPRPRNHEYRNRLWDPNIQLVAGGDLVSLLPVRLISLLLPSECVRAFYACISEL